MADQIQIRHVERRARKLKDVQKTKVLVPNRRAELYRKPPYQQVKMTAMMANLELLVVMKVRLEIKVVAERGEYRPVLNQADQNLAQDLSRGQSLSPDLDPIQDQYHGPDPDPNRIPDQGHDHIQGLSLNQGLGHIQFLNRGPSQDLNPGQGRIQNLGLSPGQNLDLNPGQGRIRNLGPSPNQSRDPDRIQSQDLDQFQGLNPDPDQFRQLDRIRSIWKPHTVLKLNYVVCC